ncbi:MAG TPA: AIR synthase related protein, partial [Myxococcales bacterium]|nr:AIR synthase related protein [Myxococcales bacterium]
GGVALSVDCNSRYCYLDPRLGAAHAVAEAARNVSCVGGEPLAVTDCLNFGNPERPEIMWQFEQACMGIADACAALGTPVVSGNVSLYNETEGKGIYPTPTIGMVGLMEDCAKNASSVFLAAGERVALIGPVCGPKGGHLGGSEYLKVVYGRAAGMPPPLDLEMEKKVQSAVRALVRDGLVRTAHDTSDGGLAVALAEMCFGRDLGCKVALPAQQGRSDALLFGEDVARILIAYPASAVERVAAVVRDRGAPFRELGEVGGPSLLIKAGERTLVDARVAELKESWSSAIPRMIGEGIHQVALEGH